jgi:predicted ATPase/DNA-binding winged helix-turn-helix (wHTH) protein
MPARDQPLIYRSGECEIDLARRELRTRGVAVPIGGRAFEIIETLVQSAGELVTKNDLMDHVWPGAIVEENTLQVHISAVRKALGPYQRLLKTESGRGYRLLGTWARLEAGASSGTSDLLPAATPAQTSLTNFPTPVVGLIGRSAAAERLRDFLSAYRVVTLTGPGGIGKTTLALEVARSLLASFEAGGWLVELASLTDPALVPSAVASDLALKFGGGVISAEAVGRTIGEKNLLLVLDNCEHVIDAVAQLAEIIVRLCPRAAVLATSREVLRIDGEYVYRVPPLDVPPEGLEELDQLLSHSAVELCIARIQASDSDFSPSREDLLAITAICRHLDGIPLAIEFAAARAATLGVQQVATGLENRFSLLTSGRRTALPRHQTLRATLDWSYDLLPEAERLLLRRLAVFSAGFTLVAAATVMAELDAAPTVTDGIANLVAKSLVTLEGPEPAARWRLLETIRLYAREKLRESGEANEVARRHAEYQRDLMQRAETEWETQRTDLWLATYTPEIDDLRTALDWANSPAGDTMVGISLAAAAVPLWCQMSLIGECRAHAERALAALDKAGIEDDRRKMKLYAAVAPSQMYTSNVVRDTASAWMMALNLAEKLDDVDYQLRALWGLWGTCLNRGEFREALEHAKRFSYLAANKADANDQLIGDRLIGFALHYLGDQAEAKRHIERMLAGYVAPTSRSHAVRFQADQRVTAGVCLARIQWLLGSPDLALQTAELSVGDALSTNHSRSLWNALAGAACPVALLVGDLAAADQYINMLLAETARDALDIWHAHGVRCEGELLVKRGNLRAGLPLLRTGTDQLRQSGDGPHIVAALCALAEAEAKTGEIAAALAAVDDGILRSDRNAGRWCSAELFRIKGEILLQISPADGAAEAERYFLRSLDLAQQQQALAWELRTATSLARLRLAQGRETEARQSLRAVYDRFTEGFETADLRVARALLDQVSDQPSPR